MLAYNSSRHNTSAGLFRYARNTTGATETMSHLLRRQNIEFSCRPESDRYAPVRRTASLLNAPHPGGPLQRFVMTIPRPICAKASANFRLLPSRKRPSHGWRGRRQGDQPSQFLIQISRVRPFLFRRMSPLETLCPTGCGRSWIRSEVQIDEFINQVFDVVSYDGQLILEAQNNATVSPSQSRCRDLRVSQQMCRL